MLINTMEIKYIYESDSLCHVDNYKFAMLFGFVTHSSYHIIHFIWNLRTFFGAIAI